MSFFVNPLYLWMAPLIAAPIIIHLLNRIRYRRVKWAAMEFLLTSERRAVRRAKLQQLLLMALRMLLLAMALGALLQPIFRGRLAALLGGSRQVAIMIDGSASMSATGTSQGDRFRASVKLACDGLESVGKETKAIGAVFSEDIDWKLDKPLASVKYVKDMFQSEERTDGSGNVPNAIRSAAQKLALEDRGGLIWILTDMQETSWHTTDTGAWEGVRAALAAAGDPRILVTQVGAKPRFNLAIEGVEMRPSVVVAGDTPSLYVRVRRYGQVAEAPRVVAEVDGMRQGSSPIAEFDAAGDGADSDVVSVRIRLDKLTEGAHGVKLSLTLGAVGARVDQFPADNDYYCVVRTGGRMPLLLVDGVPNADPFLSGTGFLALALESPSDDPAARSPFAPNVQRASDLARIPISGAAVILAEVPRLAADDLERIRKFVRDDGGLLIVFLGENAQRRAWNADDILGVKIDQTVRADPEEPFTAETVESAKQLIGSLDEHGLASVTIKRMFALKRREDGTANVEDILITNEGLPLLVRSHYGHGSVFTFAVSARDDTSNLPFTKAWVPLLHALISRHILETSIGLSHKTLRTLHVEMPDGMTRIRLPLTDEDLDGELDPGQEQGTFITPTLDTSAAGAPFSNTSRAGIYMAFPTQRGQKGVPVAALNPPVEESSPDLVDEEQVRDLLKGHAVLFEHAGTGLGAATATGGERTSSNGFPLAVAAILFLLAETVLAWHIGRPTRSLPGESARGGGDPAARAHL
jgi:aerotolerance regulator-like protein